jgi:hypothetical protein
MHVGSTATLDWESQIPHRSGPYSFKHLLCREGGNLKGLEMSLSRVLHTITAPRHRHNFDQLRIGLSGITTYGTHQKLSARTIQYVPAGTWYGPQTWLGPETETPALAAVIQFDDRNKGGFLTNDKIDAATAELKKLGEFKDGFYYPNEPREKRAIDAFEATWEQAAGRKIVYPPPFVDDPIYMHLDAVPWVKSPESGVEVKMIGAFGNHGLRISMSKVDVDAERVLLNTSHSVIAFCLSGEALVAERPFPLHSAVLLEPGETLIARGTAATTEFVEVVLPSFHDA